MYERHSENNSLTYIQSLSVPFIVDNVVVNEYDQLVVAGHPNILLFLRHEKYPRKYRAPSEVVIFSNPKSSKFYFFSYMKYYILDNFRFKISKSITYKW